MVAELHGYLMRTMPALAAIAALVLAVLPMGLVPRTAGACGRSLCLCPHELTPRAQAKAPAVQDGTAAESECPYGGCGTESASKTIYVFDGPAMDSHVPPTVFQPVFTALGCVALQALELHAEPLADEPAPHHSGFPLAQPQGGVLTPPPRA